MRFFLLPLILCFSLNGYSQDSTKAKLKPRSAFPIGIDEEGLEEPAENESPEDYETAAQLDEAPEEAPVQFQVVTPNSEPQIISLDSLVITNDPSIYEIFADPTIFNPTDEGDNTSPLGNPVNAEEGDENKRALAEAEEKLSEQESDAPFPWAFILRIAGGLLVGAFLIVFGWRRIKAK